MRILVTGSRDWTDEDVIFQALIRATYSALDKHTLVHGGAPGADTLAAKWATLFGWYVEEHKADWIHHQADCPESHRGLSICKRAGFIRNIKMVNMGADVCLAFIKNESKGATMTADLAEKAGIKVERHTN